MRLFFVVHYQQCGKHMKSGVNGCYSAFTFRITFAENQMFT